MKCAGAALYLCILASPAWSLVINEFGGILQEAPPQEWNSNATLSRRFVPAIRGIFGRQITTSCSTAGWIPCTAYPSDRGCRPPGGTCCIDGNYCSSGKDCVDIAGQTRGGCCARGKTCANSTRQCQTSGSSLCPERDFCCSASYICGHASSGGSSCNLNHHVNSVTTTKPRTTTHAPTPTRTTTRTLTRVTTYTPPSTVTLTPTSAPTVSSTTTPGTTTTTPVIFDPQSFSTTNPNAGMVAGSVIGALALAAIIAAAAAVFFIRRRRAAASGTNGPNGAVPGAGGTISATSVKESKLDAPPLVAGLSYSGVPEIHHEPGGRVPSVSTQKPLSYLDGQGNPTAYPLLGIDPTSPAMTTLTASPPGSPLSRSINTHFTTTDAHLPLPQVAAVSQQLYPSQPSGAEARYNGVPEIQDVRGARVLPTPPSPTPRFSEYSANSSVGRGSGGFYYNDNLISQSGAVAAGVGMREAARGPSTNSQQHVTFQNNMNNSHSPTSQTSLIRPSSSGPTTPLTANSEQGLLAQAQAERSSYSSGSGSGPLASPATQQPLLSALVINEEKPTHYEKGKQW